MALRKIRKLALLLTHPTTVRSLLGFYFQGYLFENGWIESFERKIPVGRDGGPLPWVTYAFIDFIGERLSREFCVLEFGCGNSTIYYAERVGTLYSVEHDADWFNKMKAQGVAGAHLTYVPLKPSGDYAKHARTIGAAFQMIIVDGRDRVNCILASIDSLSENGVIILDDSERSKYQPAITFLRERGFKRIDFWGISPGTFQNKSTTIFYRTDNCLGI